MKQAIQFQLAFPLQFKLSLVLILFESFRLSSIRSAQAATIAPAIHCINAGTGNIPCAPAYGDAVVAHA